MGPINNIPSLVQIMAWRQSGDKPLSGPMMISFPTHICVSRPQWVNQFFEGSLPQKNKTRNATHQGNSHRGLRWVLLVWYPQFSDNALWACQLWGLARVNFLVENTWTYGLMLLNRLFDFALKQTTQDECQYLYNLQCHGQRQHPFPWFIKPCRQLGQAWNKNTEMAGKYTLSSSLKKSIATILRFHLRSHLNPFQWRYHKAMIARVKTW